MKIRSGFVSNSSSSSFVLKVGEPFDTVKEVAEYMIPKREWESDLELLEKLKSVDDSKNISFRSCNYDTFIAKVDGYFLIETCHNHDWDLHSFLSGKYPESFLETYGDDTFYELPRKCEFYSLEHDVDFHEVGWNVKDRFCTECYSNKSWVNGKVICINCSKKEKT